MRRIIIILIIGISCMNSYAQKVSDIKVGLGMPILTGNTTGTEVHTVKAIPSLSAEKPIVIMGDRRNDKISINPGISFFYLTEKKELGSEVAGKIEKLNHLSTNGYVKLLYHQKIQRRSNAFVYFGGIGGAHIYTTTNGESRLYSQNVEIDDDVTKISESAKDFYNTVYYGAIVGFEPNYKVTNRFKISYELSFFPNFVTKELDKKASSIQFTVLLGINQ